MRYFVGLLLLMLTCVAPSILAVAVTSIEGSWIGSGTVSRGANVDRSRALHEKLRKDLRNVIGLYNRERQIRD
jgi:hypothetical protein